MIERVGPEQWELLQSARLAALADAPAAFGATLDDESSLPESSWRARTAEAAWFVATHRDIPAGLVALTGIDPDTRDSMPLVLDPPPAEIKILGMWVHAGFRSAGVADELIAQCARFAYDHGVASVTLGVFDDNARAIRFYERCGFAAMGTPKRSSAQPGRMFIDMTASAAALLTP